MTAAIPEGVLRVLDLFSGIGGFTLGLERAGMQTVAFCEVDPYCCRVLARHWPAVPNLGDVHRVSLVQLNFLGRIDVICGGFPCQDVSLAGSGLGLDGPRSGLWAEFARLVGLIRPRFVIVENVAGLLARGMGRILGELAALGYDAQWHCIPAARIGAPHRRDRVWIVAHTDSGRLESLRLAQHAGQSSAFRNQLDGCRAGGFGARPAPVSDAVRERLEGLEQGGTAARSAQRPGVGYYQSWWQFEPALGRVADGIPNRVDRLRGLGNAVVPEIVEVIGRALIAAARPYLWSV